MSFRGEKIVMSEEKKLNMPQSLLLLLLIIGSVAVCIRLKTGGPMIGLFFSWIIIYLFCKWLKIKYDHVVSGAYDAIRVVVPTLCLLMAIGVMIGTWLQSGTDRHDHRRRSETDRSNLAPAVDTLYSAPF